MGYVFGQFDRSEQLAAAIGYRAGDNAKVASLLAALARNGFDRFVHLAIAIGLHDGAVTARVVQRRVVVSCEADRLGRERHIGEPLVHLAIGREHLHIRVQQRNANVHAVENRTIFPLVDAKFFLYSLPLTQLATQPERIKTSQASQNASYNQDEPKHHAYKLADSNHPISLS